MNKAEHPAIVQFKLKNEIVKIYKPNAHSAFVNELYVYLFAKEKKFHLSQNY